MTPPFLVLALDALQNVPIAEVEALAKMAKDVATDEKLHQDLLVYLLSRGFLQAARETKAA